MRSIMLLEVYLMNVFPSLLKQQAMLSSLIRYGYFHFTLQDNELLCVNLLICQ